MSTHISPTTTTANGVAPTTGRYTESHVVGLVKNAGRRLSETTIRTNLETIIAGTMTGTRTARGWSASIVTRTVNPNDEWDASRVDPLSPTETFYDVVYVPESAHSGHIEYRAKVTIALDTDRKRDSVRIELENLITSMHAKGQYPKWSVESLDGEPFTVGKQALAQQSITSAITVGGMAQLDAADAIGYAPCVVPKDWNAYFDGSKQRQGVVGAQSLFGIDDHIAMVKDALDTAMSNRWEKRFHTKLIGPPGCGKSALLRAMKAAVGEESVMEFDATATTAAGAMEMLSEYEELPRVMIVEELEKGPTDTFQFLLGLMDDRAEVRKVTARKKIMRETRLLVFATINDETILDKLMDGALSSRFSNPIYFNRPSRDLLAKILQRECSLYNGDENWIDPALDLAEALNVSDPRRVISMMMLGKSALITGEYQRRLLTVGMPHRDDVEETIDSVRSRLARLVEQIQS